MLLKTPRLELRAATTELTDAELREKEALSRLLGARVPESWPPETLLDVRPLFLSHLRTHPEWEGWISWYAIDVRSDTPVLCGSVGFKGPANDLGMVEIGYSVLPEFQGVGFATEMVIGLTAWAEKDPRVNCVEAETIQDNIASQRVLVKSGYSEIGAGVEPNTMRFRHPNLRRGGS